MSEATWSMTVRRRSAVVGGVAPVGGKERFQVLVPGLVQQRDEFGEDLALPRIDRLAFVAGHHVRGGQALHRGDLVLGGFGHDQRGVEAGQRAGAELLAGGVDRRLAEPADELAGHVLERGHGAARAVGVRHPFAGCLQPAEGRVDDVVLDLRQVPLAGEPDDPGALVGRP